MLVKRKNKERKNKEYEAYYYRDIPSKNKEYEAYYRDMPSKVLTELVLDFIDAYGWIGVTMRDLTRLFDGWLYSQRDKFKRENNIDTVKKVIEEHKNKVFSEVQYPAEYKYELLFEEQHVILEEILCYVYYRHMSVFEKKHTNN